MASYFDIEDEIAWGPITLKEIKFDQNRRYKVNRRHTTALKITDNKQPNKEVEFVYSKALNPDPDSSSTSSLEPEIRDMALPSSRKELESFVPDSSVYFTAVETTTASHDAPYLSAEDTMCFINGALNIKTDFNLDKVGPEELVENTVLSPYNCSIEKFDKSSCSSTSGDRDCSVSSYEEKLHCTSSDSENVEDAIILISSDDDESLDEVQIIEQLQDTSCLLEYKDIENGSILGDSSEDVKCALSVIPEEMRSRDELMETKKSPTISSSYRTSHSQSFNPDDDDVVHENEITPPDIDFAQFDEPCHLEDTLDDTIELMDRLLRQGAERERRLIAPAENETSGFENLTSMRDDIISASFMKHPSSSCRLDPDDKIGPGPSPKSRIPTLNRHLRCPEEFKVPVTPLPQRTPSKNFKNIASPVGLYIKYSPQPLLRQNFVQKKPHAHASPAPVAVEKSKEAHQELPFASYKPARKQVRTREDKLYCPPYIQRLIKDPIVIKHERKTVRQRDCGATELKLLADTDLTRSSVSESLLNDSAQDVSILKEKTAMRK